MKTIITSGKRHYLKTVNILLIGVALVAGMITSCDDGDDGGAGYDLTMEVYDPGTGTATDLTGGSPYASGTNVSIKAVPVPGYEFDKWHTFGGGEFADANTPTTTFTMPAEHVAVAAIFVEGFCIDFEDLPLGRQFHVGDTFVDTSVVIAVHQFQLGPGQWYSGYTQVTNNWCEDWPVGYGQQMWVSNVNLNFTVASPWEGLSLLFGEYGENLNIEINGEFRNFENFHDIDGERIGDVDVSVVSGFGNDNGSLDLSGTIHSFAIGGQELCIDHICPWAYPFRRESRCVDFEDLLLGTQYHVGNTFIDSGVAIAVHQFQLGPGQWSSGYTQVTNNWCEDWPVGYGQQMLVGSVNLRFVYPGPWEGLSLLFGEYGENLNIEINGEFRNFENFHDIDGERIGDVDVSVVSGFGNDNGSLDLSGMIHSFAIGGVELCIDNVCITIPS